MAVAVVSCVVTLVDSIDLTVLTMYGYQRHFAVVTPRNALSLADDITQKIRREPLTTGMYTTRPVITMVKTIFGKMPIVVFGLPREARDLALRRCGLRMVGGRMPAEGKPEVALSAAISRNRHLRLGSIVMQPGSEDDYAIVPTRLVGIYDGPVWLAMTSESFVRDRFPVAPAGCIVMAKGSSEQRELDLRLEKAIDKSRARLWTYKGLVRETRDALSSLYLIMNVVIAIVVFAIAFLTGMLTNIYFTQRLPEFATLAAIGYSRRVLVLRVLAETGLLCAIGWLLGSVLTLAVLLAVKGWLMDPRGMMLDPFDFAAYRYTLPLPAAITVFALMAVGRRMRRLDPVSIIERRQ